MSFDYSKLKGRIVEKYDTQAAFAQALGMSKNVLSGKMNGKVRFNSDEIVNIVALLGISESEIGAYFFRQ